MEQEKYYYPVPGVKVYHISRQENGKTLCGVRLKIIPKNFDGLDRMCKRCMKCMGLQDLKDLLPKKRKNSPRRTRKAGGRKH